MKKFVKLSLAAAVATAGLTSTASAVSLEEAIKGVDISGQFRYRMQDRQADGATLNAGESTNATDVEVEIGVKVPVNDMVTAVFKIDAAPNTADNATNNDVLTVEDYYFAYANGAVSATFGMQNIPGRLTDGVQGNGLVALYNTGAGVTVGAAWFNDHRAGTAEEQDAKSVIAMGNVGPVSFMAQYVDVLDTLDSYNLKADTKVGPLSLGVEYSETGFDANNTDNSTLTAYASTTIEKVSLKASYASTGDDNSGSLHANTDVWANSVETPSEWLLWQLGTATNGDMDVVAIDASYPVTDKITVRGAYADGDIAGTDATETLGQVTYKMSKNLSAYLRLSNLEVGTNESDRGRIEVAYKF